MREPDILCKVELRGQKYDFMMPPKSPILELHGRVLTQLRLTQNFTTEISECSTGQSSLELLTEPKKGRKRNPTRRSNSTYL